MLGVKYNENSEKRGKSLPKREKRESEHDRTFVIGEQKGYCLWGRVQGSRGREGREKERIKSNMHDGMCV